MSSMASMVVDFDGGGPSGEGDVGDGRISHKAR